MTGLAGGATADKLRPIAVATCMEVIGHDEGTIIAAATKCIIQNFTKEKAIKELTPYLASSTMDFVRTLWRNVENAGTSIGGGKQVKQAAQIVVMLSFCSKLESQSE